MTVERTASALAEPVANRVAELESELAAVRAESDQPLAGFKAVNAAQVAANAALAAAGTDSTRPKPPGP